MKPNMAESYITPATGRPTIAGMKFLESLTDRLDALEARMDAVAAVASPTGGATTDTEARAAIAAIVGAAG